jgi:ABC-type multidrug transport system fused ATPase/permease subunit
MNINKLKTFLDAENKKEFIIATLLMITASIIEAFGIGLLSPLIKLVGDKNTAEYYEIISEYWNLDYKTLLLIMGLIIVICFVLKSVILTLNSYQYYKFSYNLQTKISRGLFEHYLKTSNIQIDRNKMIANIYSECEKLTHLVIIPITVIFSEITISILLILLLIWNSLYITLYSIGLFIISYLIFNKLTYKYIEKVSKKRESADYKKLKVIEKSLSQLIEIKLYNNVEHRVKNYESYALESGDSNAMNGVIGGIPRLFMETLVVFILITYTSYRIWMNGASIAEILPEITIYSVVGFRLLPSLNRISNAKSNLIYSNTIIENIYNEMNLNSSKLKNYNIATDNGSNDLNIINLESNYGFENRISFAIKKGDIVCIDGISGKGKTTLVYMLMGFLTPKFGSIEYSGVNIYDNLDWYREKLSYLPQSVVVIDGSLYKNVTFKELPSDFIEDNLFIEACKMTNIDWIENLYSSETINNISIGQAQRIGIARSLYYKRNILILDEPTSALDKKNSDAIIEKIISNSSEIIIIIITHDPSIKLLCNKHLIL